MKIKICGLTRREDCEAAVELGADFIGFNFYPKSPRCVTPARARAMQAELPETAVAVGVFVNETAERIREVCAEAGLTVAQLHGDEPPGFCAGLGVPVIKAFRVEGAEDLEGIRSCKTWAALIDAKCEGYGGSGMNVDWELVSLVRAPLKIFLAGGLTPENVGEAVRTVRPWAVDVASGVESGPGIKDRDKMKRFIEAVRDAT
jgi:phosphoribosylanthranilate isomerase